MITPKEILTRAERKVSDVLTSWLEGKTYFPMVIRSDKALTEKNFDALNNELGLLLQNSKEIRGYGYRVALKEVNTRKLGKQKLPEKIIFDEAQDFWKYLGKEKEWNSFRQDAALLRKELPQLESWLKKNPLKVITAAGRWPGLVNVCKYFISNPQPQCYLREILAQPHTKFIEENKSVLESLLMELIGEFVFKEGSCFEERFHIKTYDRLIQLRLLDKQLTQHFSGVSHLGITIQDLAKLHLPCVKVIIMENKASYSNIENFLTLPQLTGTIAIFGGGYAVSSLKQITWLKEMEILYWGDIDVQGFEMLSIIRSMFSQTQALLMNRTVFDAFSSQHTSGPKNQVSHLDYLHKSESELYHYLKGLTKNNRLEQERIPNWYVMQELSKSSIKE
nr:Wadjet anti-phage system protein JetD domain-containing protein [uncultured Chitinophaga sp.]